MRKHSTYKKYFRFCLKEKKVHFQIWEVICSDVQVAKTLPEVCLILRSILFLLGQWWSRLVSFLKNLQEDSRLQLLFLEFQTLCVWTGEGFAFKMFSAVAKAADQESTRETLPSAHHWHHQGIKLQTPLSHLRLAESESAYLTNSSVSHMHIQASKSDYQFHMYHTLMWQPVSIMEVKKGSLLLDLWT